LSTDATNRTATGRAADLAGNVGVVRLTGISIDQRQPLITVAFSPPADGSGTYVAPVTAHFTCTDARSGIAICPPDRVLLAGADQIVTGTATDLAGNSATVTTTITVQEPPPPPPPACSNLVQDPGFESGVSGFEAQDESSLVSSSSEAPLEGARSLRVAIDGYGNNVWWIRELAGATAAGLRAEAHLRSDAASGSTLQFCAMAYYQDGETVLACTPVGAEPGDRGVVTAAAGLDSSRALESVRIRMYQEGAAGVQFTLDSAVACADNLSAPPPDDPDDPPPPDDPDDPPPPPGPSAYPGYTYQLPTVRPFISLGDYAQVNQASTAYLRFEAAADQAVAGNPPYAYSATHSVLMYRLTGEPEYIDDAIARVEAQVEAAETAIASGGRPALSGDSYLEVGWYIEQLALTYDYGYARLTEAQRQRWVAYAEQAIYNVWHPAQAVWGGASHPWSGWSINDPGNNYHFSFLRATMLWALASQSMSWFTFLQSQKFGPLVDYYVALPGGGSREGTGYGTAQKNLFENYIYWKASTGEDLAALSTHARDTIDYWVHATLPTRDRFAPIGDQSRSSIPELYDYHENLVHAAVVLSGGTDQAKRGTWWLQHNSVNGVANSFNLAGDLLPYPDPPVAPTALAYHASAVGHFFARSSWDTDATWLSVVAGPYDQSHAHQDQGSFTFVKNDWLAVTSNIWSHSGINQDVTAHNVVRFVRNGATVPQSPSTTVQSTMSYAETPGNVTVHADLTNAYAASQGAVASWTRDFEFLGDVLRVHDRCTVAANVQPIFQLHVPVLPVMQADGSIQAGTLRVLPLHPATVTIVSMADADFSQGYRIDLTVASGCAFDVELQAAP
jgi:hypothetical protein